MSEQIVDIGQKIGGARKDLAAALRNNNLGSLTDAEKSDWVTKEAAWPKPDWAQLVDEGMRPECAALLKIVRDRLPARPVARNHNFSDACQNYMDAMRVMSEEALKCHVAQDVTTLRSRFEQRLITEHAVNHARIISTIIPGRTYPYVVSREDAKRATVMIAEGFPGEVPPWRKNLRAVLNRHGEWQLRDRKGWLDVPPQETEEQAWALAESRYNAQRAGAKAARAGLAEMPARPHLRDVVRQSMDVRPENRVDGQNFLDTFGFRGVEFGEWLPQDERQAVLDHAWDAMHDLCIATGLEPYQLSLGGTLALAFGARGKGRAAAHYEPGRKVINLTRMSGAGSLAHEWSHALDHWIGEQGGPSMEAGQPRFASGYRTPRNSRLKALANLPLLFAPAVDALVSNMYRTPVSLADRLKPILSAKNEAQLHLNTLSPWSSEATNARSRLHSLSIQENFARTQVNATLPTSFYRQAFALSGKDGYYSRPTEMHARSFECMVADTLKAAGIRSDYLVQGVEEDRFAGKQWKGNPYPVGEERVRLNRMHVHALAHAKTLIPMNTLDHTVAYASKW